MKEYYPYKTIIVGILLAMVLLQSCKDFLSPDQEIDITEDKLYDDWYEYRSIAVGLYSIHADLVEQIVILGELRGDLMNITENANADMVEIYNFNISEDNEYAQPTNFFKLITAANSFITVLKTEHPEILDPKSPVTNYDRLYGEALCMRAWAYFNAVRIYGKVPFLPESLTNIDEVNAFLETPGIYIDSLHIIYGVDGYDNDTLENVSVQLEKQYYDQDLIIDYFTNELENEVKAVGVNHYIDNNDQTWEVTVWNEYAWNALLGLMYLTDGDLAKAAHHFENITLTNSDNYRYQIDQSYGFGNWRNIFTNIDLKEHIFTLWFNKYHFQQNHFQEFFETREPHKYMLKPTKIAVDYWETIWDDYRLEVNNNQPWLTETIEKGTPGDFYRGYGVSYSYTRNGQQIPANEIRNMLMLRAENDTRSANIIVEGADTVISKYSVNKGVFDQDANFIVYRAAGVHLWLAELYVWWKFEQSGTPRESTSTAVDIVNDGAYYSPNINRAQKGIRGRVGYGGKVDGIRPANINYLRDPYTNEVTGYIDVTGDFRGQQMYLEDQIIAERARELAFEGERFYDLMRVAKRRNDPSFLASRVSAKFPPERRQEIYNYLLDENNWFINYFE